MYTLHTICNAEVLSLEKDLILYFSKFSSDNQWYIQNTVKPIPRYVSVTNTLFN